MVSKHEVFLQPVLAAAVQATPAPMQAARCPRGGSRRAKVGAHQLVMVVEIWSAVGLVRPTWSRRGLKVFRVPHRHLRNRAGASVGGASCTGGVERAPTPETSRCQQDRLR